MIDLNSHILFDVDDGATTLADSLAMARVAAHDGTHIIAATPHSPGSSACRRYDPAQIHERVAQINAALASEGVPIEVVSGSEIFFTSSIVEQLKRGQLLPYGQSRTILLELVGATLPSALDTMLFNLQLAGYRVLIAHPERIAEVQQNPNRLIPLIERGVLMQLTAEALIGGHGERLRTTAETLLTHQLIHVLASDAHGLPPRRPPLLRAAHTRAAELVGQAAANALVETTPAALLANQPPRIPAPRPVSASRSHWWKR